jgi:hypothetical protein
MVLVLYPILFGFPKMIISWDVFSYYLYLPFTFIYNDLSISNPETLTAIVEKYQVSDSLYQAYPLENGNWMIKTSMGMALFYLPFFAIGHIVALGTDYPVDGFSAPYQWAMIGGSLSYTLLGIWLLRRLLMQYFGEQHTALLLVFTVLGTNYLILNTESMMMSHVPLFTAVCALILITTRWHREATVMRSIGLGAILGLMALARPTEAVIAVIPALWGIGSVYDLKQKFRRMFGKDFKYLMIVVATGLVVVFPQFLYWKWVSGHWIYMSYNNPQEGLDLTHPHTFNFLFSFRKGWYIYTPLMLLATLGFAALWKYRRDFFWPYFVFFLVNLYIISSWTTWWYAFSFSQRAVLQSYPIMAIALGYGLRYARRNSPVLRHALIGLCFLLVGLNLFQSWQFKAGILHGERMTAAYYWKIFGRTSVPEGAEKLLLVERSFTDKEAFSNYEDYYEPNLLTNRWNKDDHDTALVEKEGLTALMLKPEVEFSPTFDMSFSEITSTDHAWIEVHMMVFVASPEEAAAMNLVCCFMHNEWAYKYRAVPLSELIPEDGYNKWTAIRYQYLTPEPRVTSDVLRIYLWNQGRVQGYFSDLRVLSYIRKW